MNLKGVSKSTWVRIIVSVLVLSNLVSESFFKHKLLPFTDAQLDNYVTAGLTVIVTLWTGWKNNSLTAKAQQADAVLKDLKSQGK